MIDRTDCPMRAENGNCLPVGGFCTAVLLEDKDESHATRHRAKGYHARCKSLPENVYSLAETEEK